MALYIVRKVLQECVRLKSTLIKFGKSFVWGKYFINFLVWRLLFWSKRQRQIMAILAELNMVKLSDG